jgi:uncharacterized hydrophobic protein (TIGR00271 family)
MRMESVTPVASPEGSRWLGGLGDARSWVEVIGQASSAARLLVRYVAVMAAVGAIAAVGVLDANPILIVGAMALSPDIVPMSAACVGVVGLRANLVVRAVATLAIGLATAAIASGSVSQLLLSVGALGTASTNSSIGTLATPDISTVVIALAAGVAGMLTFESQGSIAIGVGISVTTIPAVAYLGVVTGEGHTQNALNALAVLVTNVLGVVVAGTATLFIQRRWRDRHTRAQQLGPDVA